MAQKKSFLVYFDNYPMVQALPLEQRGLLLTALFEYGMAAGEPDSPSIPEILEYFADRVKEYKKIGVVYVESAVPLSEEQKEKIEKRVLETTDYVSLEPHYQVDETLIGGLVIRIGGRVADSSIRTRLENLRRELSKIQLV